MIVSGNSLAVPWLGLGAFIAKGLGSIPGRELRSRKPRGTAKKKKRLSQQMQEKHFTKFKTQA